MMTKNQRTLTIVADRVASHKNISISNRTLESVSDLYFEAIEKTIKSIGWNVILFETPKKLIKQIDNVRNTSILSLWSGTNSRSKRALVSSIAEAAGIRYIGADPYTAIVCQDKAISKIIAQRFGFKSPLGIILESNSVIDENLNFNFPVVVKPCFEGGSVGIDQKSLCYSWEDVYEQTKSISKKIGGSIIIEEFIRGAEISICILGDENGAVKKMEATELNINGFDIKNNIWSMEIKKSGDFTSIHKNITEKMPNNVMKSAKLLFESLEKVDIFRIDGRMHNGDFYVIELSPDVFMGPSGSFSGAFMNQYYNYKNLWSDILKLA